MDGFPLACVHPPGSAIHLWLDSHWLCSRPGDLRRTLVRGLDRGVTERWRPVKDCQADDCPARDMRAVREKPKN